MRAIFFSLGGLSQRRETNMINHRTLREIKTKMPKILFVKCMNAFGLNVRMCVCIYVMSE